MIENLKTKTECAICPVKLWEVKGMKLKKTKEYNEIDVQLSDLSRMTIGVCSKHLKPKKLDLKIMTEKNRQGWLEEVAFGIGSEDWVKNYGLKLKITGVM